MTIENTIDQFLFTELGSETLTEGQPFAGFAIGEFIDMAGREVKFAKEELAAYLKNTVAFIAELQVKGHDGLPIDSMRHERGEAAGWITGAEEGEVKDSKGTTVPVLLLAAKWTKLGVKLIEDRILVNFSPSVDTEKKRIVGGSLTNWPASVDAKGVPLFSAVELSQGIRILALGDDEGFGERISRVRGAWRLVYPDREDGPYMYVREVFDDYLILSYGDKVYQVGYAVGDSGVIQFEARDKWLQVRQTWVEAAQAFLNSARAMAGRILQGDEFVGDGAGETETPPADTNLGGASVAISMAELTEEQREDLEAQARAAVMKELGQTEGETPDQTLERLQKQLKLSAFADVANLGEVREELMGGLEEALKAEMALMQKQSGAMLAKMMSDLKLRQHIADFSQRVTGGTDDAPRAIPVKAEDMDKFLSSLSDGQREAAEAILGAIVEQGLVDFDEVGHGKRVQGTTQLEPEMAVQLREFIEAGGKIEDFFEAAEAVLGDMASYDLSPFEEA